MQDVGQIHIDEYAIFRLLKGQSAHTHHTVEGLLLIPNVVKSGILSGFGMSSLSKPCRKGSVNDIHYLRR